MVAMPLRTYATVCMLAVLTLHNACNATRDTSVDESTISHFLDTHNNTSLSIFLNEPQRRYAHDVSACVEHVTTHTTLGRHCLRELLIAPHTTRAALAPHARTISHWHNHPELTQELDDAFALLEENVPRFFSLDTRNRKAYMEHLCGMWVSPTTTTTGRGRLLNCYRLIAGMYYADTITGAATEIVSYALRPGTHNQQTQDLFTGARCVSFATLPIALYGIFATWYDTITRTATFQNLEDPRINTENILGILWWIRPFFMPEDAADETVLNGALSAPTKHLTAGWVALDAYEATTPCCNIFNDIRAFKAIKKHLAGAHDIVEAMTKICDLLDEHDADNSHLAKQLLPSCTTLINSEIGTALQLETFANESLLCNQGYVLAIYEQMRKNTPLFAQALHELGTLDALYSIICDDAIPQTLTSHVPDSCAPARALKTELLQEQSRESVRASRPA